MTARDLRITIVRAWTFRDATGAPAATTSISAHRERYAEIQCFPSTGQPRLPWPPFPSNFWLHQLGRTNYKSIEPPLLVGALVPLRVVVTASFSHPWCVRPPLAELFIEPFGIWTSVTVDLIGAESEKTPDLAAAVARGLKADLTIEGQQSSSQLRHGLDPDAVAAEIGLDLWPGLTLVEAGTVRLMSDRVEPDVCDVEAKRLFAGHLAPGDVEAHPLKVSRGAFAASSTRVGLSLSDGAGAASRLKCLHHNQALLLGHLLLFGAEVRQIVPEGGARFQDLAARVVNHLYRAEPLILFDSGSPKRLGIYRSMLAPVWLGKSNLAAAVNERTDASVDGSLPHI